MEKAYPASPYGLPEPGRKFLEYVKEQLRSPDYEVNTPKSEKYIE